MCESEFEIHRRTIIKAAAAFAVGTAAGSICGYCDEVGAFENGVGTFTADDMDNDLPIKVKGVWDRITPESCRWYQVISRDGGKTWQENWLMDWTRVRGSGVRNCSDRPMQGRYQCL